MVFVPAEGFFPSFRKTFSSLELHMIIPPKNFLHTQSIRITILYHILCKIAKLKKIIYNKKLLVYNRKQWK